MKFLLLKKKSLAAAILALVLLVCGLLAVGMTGAYAVYAEKTTRKLPIYCVDIKKSRCPLTQAGAPIKLSPYLKRLSVTT